MVKRPSNFWKTLRSKAHIETDSLTLPDAGHEDQQVAVNKIESTCDGWLTETKNDPDYAIELAKALEKQAHSPQAYQLLARVRKEYPKNRKLAVKTAEMAQAAGLFERAKFEWTEYRKRFSGTEEAALGILSSLLALQDFENSFEQAQVFAIDHPQSMPIWHSLIQATVQAENEMLNLSDA